MIAGAGAVDTELLTDEVVAASLQPNQPGVLQVLVLDVAEEVVVSEVKVEVEVGTDEPVVSVGAGSGVGLVIVVVIVVVSRSLQPNQPGVRQVVVVTVLVMVVV